MGPTFILPFLTFLVLVSSNTYLAQYPNVQQYPAQWNHPGYPQQYQQASPQFAINYPNIGTGLSSNYAGHITPGYQPQYTMPSQHPQHLQQPHTGSMYPQTIQSYPDISGLTGYGGAVPGATNEQFPTSFSYPEYMQNLPKITGQINSGSVYPGLQQAKPEISVKVFDEPINKENTYPNAELNLNELNQDRNSGRVLYPGLQQVHPNFEEVTGPSRHNLMLPLNQDVNNYPALDSTSFNNQHQVFPGYNPQIRGGELDLMNVDSKSSKLFLPEDLNVPMIKHCPEYLRKYLENLKKEGRLEYPYSKTVDVSIIDICMPQKSGVVHFEDKTSYYDDLSQEVDPE